VLALQALTNTHFAPAPCPPPSPPPLSQAILKEYEFAPASQSLTIAEGTNSMLTIRAKRVAFSALGLVKLLDGNPEKNCVVQAQVV
jgi:hypothetical protein